MNTCKTCAHWKAPTDEDGYSGVDMCRPLDPDAYKPMDRGFEVRLCGHPGMTRFEAPIERNGFGLTDASNYLALLATAEDFGCVRHEFPATPERTTP